MRVNDAILGLIAILIGVGVLLHVQTFPLQDEGRPGPALFPSVLSILFIVAGIILFVQSRRQCSNQPWCARVPGLTNAGIGNILVTLLAIVFYSLASETIGFLSTSFIIMLALMLMLKAEIKYAIPVAAGMTVFIYIIFHKMLLVPLPRGFVYF